MAAGAEQRGRARRGSAGERRDDFSCRPSLKQGQATPPSCHASAGVPDPATGRTERGAQPAPLPAHRPRAAPLAWEHLPPPRMAAQTGTPSIPGTQRLPGPGSPTRHGTGCADPGIPGARSVRAKGLHLPAFRDCCWSGPGHGTWLRPAEGQLLQKQGDADPARLCRASSWSSQASTGGEGSGSPVGNHPQPGIKCRADGTTNSTRISASHHLLPNSLPRLIFSSHGADFHVENQPAAWEGWCSALDIT